LEDELRTNSAAGVLRTVTATYTLAFFSAGALCLIAALVVLPIGRGRRELPEGAVA